MAETGAGAAGALDARIAALHRGRPRVWSVVITVFGDAVVPRGGQVWLSTLSTLFDRLGVNPGTLGAALSRLTAENWLTRERVGRRSRYRLADAGKKAFNEASRRIYGSEENHWSGLWTSWFLEDPSPKVVTELAERGFGQLGGAVFLRPDLHRPEPVPAPLESAVRLGTAKPEGDLSRLARRGWPLDRAEARYAEFVAAFTPLLAALEGSPIRPLDALAARTLLVHEFRRALLREPRLPAACFTPPSPRFEARALFGDLYIRLFEASERSLEAIDEPGGLETGGEVLEQRLARLRLAENITK